MRFQKYKLGHSGTVVGEVTGCFSFFLFFFFFEKEVFKLGEIRISRLKELYGTWHAMCNAGRRNDEEVNWD